MELRRGAEFGSAVARARCSRGSVPQEHETQADVEGAPGSSERSTGGRAGGRRVVTATRDRRPPGRGDTWGQVGKQDRRQGGYSGYASGAAAGDVLGTGAQEARGRDDDVWSAGGNEEAPRSARSGGGYGQGRGQAGSARRSRP